MEMDKWIGVDLDGTLAFYDKWRGTSHIGRPIPAMVERVKDWIEEGKTVKIFTARICDGMKSTLTIIEDWTELYIGTRLEVTNIKDYGMIELWDDRAIRVVANTGQSVAEYINDPNNDI